MNRVQEEINQNCTRYTMNLGFSLREKRNNSCCTVLYRQASHEMLIYMKRKMYANCERYVDIIICIG